jgi:hypothetical protein
MNRIENTVEDLAKKVSEIDLQIKANHFLQTTLQK